LIFSKNYNQHRGIDQRLIVPPEWSLLPSLAKSWWRSGNPAHSAAAAAFFVFHAALITVPEIKATEWHLPNRKCKQGAGSKPAQNPFRYGTAKKRFDTSVLSGFGKQL
jgi:hypothetical protein